MYITRVAPSPTGFAHLGTARTAVHNWLAARASGGKFIVRIDDTDTERNNEDAVAPIFETFAWLGLDYDQTFRQSDRIARYRWVAYELVAAGMAYVATNGAIVLDVRTVCNTVNIPDAWVDDAAGSIAITDTAIAQIDGRNGHLVLLRGTDKGSTPTYQFASVVDDYDSGVNYIIRGVDHQTNTTKQVVLWLALSTVLEYRPLPRFAHVGLIFMNGKKMSKRDGAASMLAYKEQDYDPDGLFNFLLRMGWGPRKDDATTSILTRKQALELFLTGGRLRNSNAAFDEAKLRWYNKMHKKMKG